MNETHENLEEYYQLLREKYFLPCGINIPPVDCVEIIKTGKLTKHAGSCSQDGTAKKTVNDTVRCKHTIKLSTHYHRKYPDEVQKTLAHEMLHTIVTGHGGNFERLMNKLKDHGCPIDLYAKERAKEKTYRWKIYCTECTWTRRYQRRGKYVKILLNEPNRLLCPTCETTSLTVERID